MIPFTLGEVAAAVEGVLAGGADPAATVTGPVVVDSRLVTPGGLFAAVAGERVDGHDYAAAAVDAGAVAVLANRDVGVPAVVVTDVVAALGLLASALLRRLPQAVVVGVTGSSGKTSTKDLLAQVLRHAGPTIAPAGSFNNEIGLPLTVLRADESTRHLVLEYSARGIGHVAYLCGVAPPSVGVVLNVGTAHLGEFGSREKIAVAKAELVEALPPAGVAVLNADDPLVAAMAAHTAARVVMFGLGAGPQVHADGVRLDPLGRPSFRLVCPEGRADVRLAVHGEHQVANALAVAAVALELGMAVGDVATALADARVTSRWRMEVDERDDGVTVVNDAYNANPDSMRAALRALVAIAGGDGTGAPRRTWAVLGEMLELGEASAAEHEALGRLAVRMGVGEVVAVGPGAAQVHAGASAEHGGEGRSMLVPDPDAALTLLRDRVRPGDVVLVKASRAVGLERVAEELLATTGPGR